MRAPIDSPPLRSLVSPGRRWPSRSATSRARSRGARCCGRIFEEMPGIPRARRHHPHRHRHAPHRTPTPNSSACSGATCSTAAAWSTTTAATTATLERDRHDATGVDVRLNREWLAADVRITTGFVEPHFFAGFSGGPKMVAPGLAGLATVMTLHDAARIGHPNATWGITEGNPIHDDVRAIAAMAPPTLLHRRGAQPRAEDHGRLRRQPLRRAQAGVRAT